MKTCTYCNNSLDDNAAFCPFCGNKFDENYTQPAINSIAVQEEKPKNKCSSLAIVFGAIGSMPVLNFIFLPPAIVLAIFGAIFGKKATRGLVIASCIVIAISLTVSIPLTISAFSDSDDSTTQTETQSDDSDKKTDESSSSNSIDETHKHDWAKATCEAPTTCKGCGETKDSALGHTTDCGVCSRCNTEFRKQSPITVLGWTHEIDFLGGVEWNFQIKNNTDKQIKYVTLKWDCYNAVGDLIEDDLSFGSKSSVEVKITGPIDPHSISDTYCNDRKFYNDNLDSYEMKKIIVEYMDGTKEDVTQYHDNVIG